MWVKFEMKVGLNMHGTIHDIIYIMKRLNLEDEDGEQAAVGLNCIHIYSM